MGQGRPGEEVGLMKSNQKVRGVPCRTAGASEREPLWFSEGRRDGAEVRASLQVKRCHPIRWRILKKSQNDVFVDWMWAMSAREELSASQDVRPG